jgi:CubicO group peptidase (beta-lactamase class C family)
MDVSAAARIADDLFGSASDLELVPGIVYGVVHGGRLVHVEGRGAATIGGPAPDVDSVFRIASMTKSFTAAAILMLRDDGLLRLDDPLTVHLPFAASIGSPDGVPVTIRDVLTMGGGLATDDPWGDRQESLPPLDFDALVAGGLSFCRQPGTAFEYSNTGYALLGRVIDEVSGQPYREFVRDRLLVPLGMTSTGYDPRSVAADRLATGYRIDATGRPVEEPVVTPGTFSAMGGLLSTVHDLTVWVTGMVDAWSTGRVNHPVRRSSLREAQEIARFASLEETTGPGEGSVATGYGFGLMVEHHKVLGVVVSHSGGYPGFGSHMRWHPASGWGVIALGNSSYARMRPVAANVLARIVVDAGAAHGSKPAVPAPPWPQTLAAMEVAEELLRGSDAAVSDDAWSPNMDLDIPRAERMDVLSEIRDAVGAPRRDVDSVEHATRAQASWTMTGDAGTARLELLMTPERVPRLMKLDVTRVK